MVLHNMKKYQQFEDSYRQLRAGAIRLIPAHEAVTLLPLTSYHRKEGYDVYSITKERESEVF